MIGTLDDLHPSHNSLGSVRLPFVSTNFSRDTVVNTLLVIVATSATVAFHPEKRLTLRIDERSTPGTLEA